MNKSFTTLNQALLAAMESHDSRVCFHFKRGTYFQELSYRQFQNVVFRLANFFYQHGFSPGDRLALIANNSVEWLAAYIAGLFCGGVAVPVHPSLPANQQWAILHDAGVSLLVTQQQLHQQIFDHSTDPLPNLNFSLVLETASPPITTNRARPHHVSAMADVLKYPLTAESRQRIRHQVMAVQPSALALIDYKSSESHTLKGAMFTQKQLFATTQNMAQWFIFETDDVAFTVLPWSYAPSLYAGLHYFLFGVPNGLSSGEESAFEDNQFEDIRQISPTVALTIPFAFDRQYHKVMQEISQLPQASQEVFHWALAMSKEYRTAGLTASGELRERFVRADMMFFNRLRGQMGGRLRRLYSVGAPLANKTAEFFTAIGVPLRVVYSLTEASGFPAISRSDAHRPGSCGQVAPGFQIRIADDGEILIRGETVMQGYWQRTEETAEIIDPDGWLYTGDFGRFDENGYLYLTGRKQSLIVLSNGRKIEPDYIEQALIAIPFIVQAVVFGNGKPYLSALILPDLAMLVDQLEDNQDEFSDLTTHPQIKSLMDEIIHNINRQLDQDWIQIKAYRLLNQPLYQITDGSIRLNPLNRHRIAEQHAPQLAAMYPQTISPQEKTVTQVQIDPEELRALLEKQEILDAWMADANIGFMFDLARQKQIDTPSMVHICEMVATIAQMQHEEKPLSTVFIVADPANITRLLPVSEIQLLRYDYIRRMRQVVTTLAEMVDGQVLAYGVDKHGYVRGIYKLEVAIPPCGSTLLGKQARHLMSISQQCDAIVFFVPVGGRQVRVFAEGQLVGRYANGSWSVENFPELDALIAQLAEQKLYDLALLRRLLQCAFQMSDENQGAIFMVGEANTILEKSDAPEISDIANIQRDDITALSDQALINFAKQDGATIIDWTGIFRGCMVLLRPDAETQAEIGIGKGARHSSAAKMSAEANCLAITVSQDGPITVYDCGQRILSI